MNLNILEWKEFKFGKLISKIYKGKAINKEDLSESTDRTTQIRYITRTSINNGCELLADIRNVDELCIEEKNAITIGDTTATCFYQPEEFIVGDHMVIIRADWLNELTGLYIVTLLNNEQYKYSYGRAYLMERIKDTSIKLPIKKSNNLPIIDETYEFSDEGYIPDWKFMENYIKSLHYKPLTTKNTYSTNLVLDVTKWKEFKVSSILSVYNGKGITKEEIEENIGDFTVVQSGEENNGVLGKIDRDYCISMDYTISEKPCLTVARSGSAGFVSFQNDGCVVGDSAKILLLEESNASTEVYLFIQTILTAHRFKYAYGRKVTEDKYMNDVVELPILYNKNGTPFIDKTQKYSKEGYVPDWQFMKNYIKSLPYGDRLEDVI